MNTAVLVTCIRNFRKNRGPVSGILKGYVGLSTAIFTDICSALFADDPATFLLMLTLVPLLVCLTAVLFLREVPPSSTPADEKEETKFFNLFNIVAIVVAVYLLTFDITGPHGRLLSRAFAIVLLFLLACPLLIPLYCMLQDFNRSGSLPSLDPEGLVSQPLIGQKGTPEVVADPAAEQKEELVEEIKPSRPSIGEDHTIVQAIRTFDFWILFASFLCGVGTGLAVMNNMGQMGLALGYVDISMFVSLTSIWGFFGRILSGSVSEYFIR